jgi:hypothetical protein
LALVANWRNTLHIQLLRLHINLIWTMRKRPLILINVGHSLGLNVANMML